MINCFEARQEFPALWRKAATAERRAELLAHLGECAKCDHAFRLFALTAPALHSERMPGADARERGALRRDYSPLDRPYRFAAASRASSQSRPWMAMGAAAMIFLFSSSAAYYSVKAPADTLTDEISSSDTGADSESMTDLFGSEFAPAGNDFAG